MANSQRDPQREQFWRRSVRHLLKIYISSCPTPGKLMMQPSLAHVSSPATAGLRSTCVSRNGHIVAANLE